MVMWANLLHGSDTVRASNSNEVLFVLEEDARGGAWNRRSCSMSGGGEGVAAVRDGSESHSGGGSRIAHGQSATRACRCI